MGIGKMGAVYKGRGFIRCGAHTTEKWAESHTGGRLLQGRGIDSKGVAY